MTELKAIFVCKLYLLMKLLMVGICLGRFEVEGVFRDFSTGFYVMTF